MRVIIDKLGMNGEGVARCTESEYTDKVCFVDGALPGEEVDIEILKDKKSYCYGRIKDILQLSSHRISPICPYYGECGGCNLQHMDKLLQLEFKRSKVSDSLKKIAGIDCVVEDVLRLNDFNYRNKMVFPISTHVGHAVLGMFRHNSHKVVSIEGCLLTGELINKVYIVSKDYFENSNFVGYDFEKKTGDIKYLVVRVIDKSVLVTIVSKKKVNLKEYFLVLQSHFENVGLSNIIGDSDDEILSGKYYHIDGLKQLNLTECGINYSVDNRGFLQVNSEVKTELYNLVLNEVTDDDYIIDAYSGAGLLSAIISKKSKLVKGVEINKSASDSAKQLALDNNLKNIEFINGDVKDYIDKVIAGNTNISIVLDPPRSGCDGDVVSAIMYHADDIKKIIYISCNPATLARDISLLKKNFKTTKVVPIDMFPQCKHVETFVVMENINM